MIGALTYDELMLVMVLAVGIPLALALFPRLPIPNSVVEILAGIVVGPSVLGLVQPDEVIEVLATLGRRVPPLPRRARARLRRDARPPAQAGWAHVRPVGRDRVDLDDPARGHGRDHRPPVRHGRALGHGARDRHAGAEGRAPDAHDVREVRRGLVLDRRVRVDRAAVAALHRVGRRWRRAGDREARHPRVRGARDRVRSVACRQVPPPRRHPLQAAGHERADPHPCRRAGAARRCSPSRRS